MRGRNNKVGPDPFWNIENYLTIYMYLHEKILESPLMKANIDMTIHLHIG